MRLAARCGVLGVVLVAAASFGRPATVHACSCADPVAIGVPNSTAPINTHVWLWTGWRSRRQPESFTLYESGPNGFRRDVDVDVRQHGSSSRGMVTHELVPKQMLAPNTTYAVIEDVSQQIVLDFTTTSAVDARRPRWSGISKVSYEIEEVYCCACQSGAPYADFDVDAALDDTTATDELVVGVWVANARGEIDDTRPPDLWTLGGDRFALGAVSSCSPRNFVFPKQTSLKLGVKVFDVAGHASRLVDIRFPIAKPRLIDRRKRR